MKGEPNGQRIIEGLAEAIGRAKERDEIIAWLKRQEKEHAESYQIALGKNDQAAMDRCAARSRSYGRAADAIASLQHKEAGDAH